MAFTALQPDTTNPTAQSGFVPLQPQALAPVVPQQPTQTLGSAGNSLHMNPGETLLGDFGKIGSALTGSEQKLAAGATGAFFGSGAQNTTNQLDANEQAFLQHAIQIRNQQKAQGKDTSSTDKLISGMLGSQRQASDLMPQINTSNSDVLSGAVGTLTDIATAGTYSKAGLVGDKAFTTGLTKSAAPVAQAAAQPLKQTLQAIGQRTAANSATGAGIGYGYDVSNNLQQGKTGAAVLTPGAGTLTGALLPVGVGGYRAGVAISKEQAPRFINSLIKPKTADFSYGKDPGRTVSALGITGNSLPDFANNITAAKNEVIGPQIGAIYELPANQAVRLNVTGDINKIDTAIAEAAKGGKNNQGLVTQLNNIKDAILYEHGINDEGVISKTSTTPQDLSALSPKEAQALIQHVADQTQFTGRPSDDKLINSTLKQVYGGIREKINAGVSPNNPEIKELNQQYADLTSAEIATRNRDKIVQRSNMVSLPSGGAAAAGAIVTAIVTGGAAIPAILGGASAYAVEKAFESTAVKTRVAAWLGKQTPGTIQQFLTKNPSLRTVLVRGFPALIGKLNGNANTQTNQ